MHQVWVYDKVKNRNITDYISDLKLKTSSDQLAQEVSFDIAYSDVNVDRRLIAPTSKIFVVNNGKELFRGFVEENTVNGRTSKSVICYDYAWYMNENEEGYQFNSNITSCINKICTDFEIPIGNIVSIPTNYKKIVKGALSKLIQDMLDFAEKEQGLKYYWEFREGKMFVERRDETVKVFTTSIFGNNVGIENVLSDVKYKAAIGEMKNAIKVVDQDENSLNVLAFVEDKNSQYIYGKLQKLESLDKKEKDKALNIARNLLKDLNKLGKEVTFTCPGDDNCRANRLVKMKETVTGFDGIWNIKSCEHTITNNSHKMNLILEGI